MHRTGMLRVAIRRRAVVVLDSIRVEAVEVEEVGVGEEVEVVAEVRDLVRQLVAGRRDGIEAVDVLRHVRRATASSVISRHDGLVRSPWRR